MGRREKRGNIGKWKFEKANWEKYKILSEDGMKLIKINEGKDIETINEELVNAAKECLPKGKERRWRE